MLRLSLIATMLLAASAGELLQKGIYTQDTVGDLDGAIKIYRQILNTASESRAVAAQAQYRIGLCLLEKGDSAAATQAFEKLIKDYPEQKELTDLAQQKMPRVNLIPTPWPEREYAQYRVSGDESENAIAISIEPSPESANHILLGLLAAPAALWYRAEVDRETLAPISTWAKTDSSATQDEYQKNQVRITIAGKPRTLPLGKGVFDFWEFPFVLRRLPLAENYEAEIPILMFGLTNSLEAKVEALEDIAVPAGKFRCFKALVNGMGDPMTVWYSADASRTMVKFSYQKVYAELAQINSTGPQPTTYRGEDGFSFVAPAGWIVGEPQQPADGGTLIQLTDPEGQATGVWVYRLPRNPGAPNQPDETIAQKEKERLAMTS